MVSPSAISVPNTSAMPFVSFHQPTHSTQRVPSAPPPSFSFPSTIHPPPPSPSGRPRSDRSRPPTHLDRYRCLWINLDSQLLPLVWRWQCVRVMEVSMLVIRGFSCHNARPLAPLPPPFALSEPGYSCDVREHATSLVPRSAGACFPCRGSLSTALWVRPPCTERGSEETEDESASPEERTEEAGGDRTCCSCTCRSGPG